MNVLYVEPSKTYQRVLKDIFYEYDFDDVALCATAQEAMNQIEQQDFDLICIAMYLRDMDGAELCKQMRECKKLKHVPIILITSKEHKETLNKSISAGITDIFQKNDVDAIRAYLQNFKEYTSYNELEGHILYLEDSMVIANMMIAVLEDLGYTIDHFTHAEDGLEALQKNEYDLILTDVVLAGKMSGLGLVRAIRGLENKKNALPILAMSGFDDTSRKIELLRVGANDYVSKPVINEELSARVVNLITNKKLLDRVESQQARLHDLAMKDQLTGLYNRHFLSEMAPKKIGESRRHKIPLSLIVIDVDKFKPINDTYGHSTGDEVLKELGKLLKASCRQEDFAARFGGEEFVLLLSHCDLDNAVKKAERMRIEISELKPSGLDVTASFGVATLPIDQDHCDFSALFSAADRAVYIAKETGRNKVISGEVDI